MLNKINYIFDRRQKRNLFILFIVILGGAGMELLGVSLIMPLVTVITDENFMTTNYWAGLVCDLLRISTRTTLVLVILIALIVVYIVKNVYMILMYNLQYLFTYNNQRKLATRLMGCYLDQEYLFHLSKNSSELQRNVTVDVDQFFSTVLNYIQLLSELTTCIFLLAYLMIVDVTTTIGVISIIGVCVVFFYALFRKYLGILGVRYREATARATKWVLQSFGGIKEIKVMNREKYFLNHYDEAYIQSSTLQRKHKVMQIIPKPVMESVIICGLLIVLAVQVILGADISNFVPTLSVFAIAAFRMLPAFNRITAYLASITFTKASVNAVYDDLKEVEVLQVRQNAMQMDPLEIVLHNSISLQDVSFKYPNTDNYVLDKVSLEIPANHSVALIGPSGAGKTTLADVILTLLTPESGTVKADGINVFEHTYAWHKVLGYIPQTIYLMDDTIRNNVVFGIPANEIDDGCVWEALREAQLDEFVRGLDKGLDTEVGECGVRLSGGQRQRIGIARALYSNPSVLVLDEATSALDNETETAVMEAIDSLQGSKTLIIIAHRLTTIRNCDIIYEVDDGKVVQKSKEEVFGKPD